MCRYEFKNKEIENPEYNRPTPPIRRRRARRNGFRLAQPSIDIINNPFAQLIQEMQVNNNAQLPDNNTYGARLMQEIFGMINEEDDLQRAIEQSLQN